MKQEASALFSCSVARKPWLLRLSLVPRWLHYPLFQVVQVLPTVFSYVCAPTRLQRSIYGHITATLYVAMQHKRREARKGAGMGCTPGVPALRRWGKENWEFKGSTSYNTKHKSKRRRRERPEINPLPLPTRKNLFCIWDLLSPPLHTTPKKGDLEPRTPSFRPCNGSQWLQLWFEFVHTSEVCFLATWAKRSSQNLGIIPGSSLSPIILEIHYEQEESDTD